MWSESEELHSQLSKLVKVTLDFALISIFVNKTRLQLLKSSQERRLSIDQCKLIICCGVSIFTNNEY